MTTDMNLFLVFMEDCLTQCKHRCNLILISSFHLFLSLLQSSTAVELDHIIILTYQEKYYKMALSGIQELSNSKYNEIKELAQQVRCILLFIILLLKSINIARLTY